MNHTTWWINYKIRKKWFNGIEEKGDMNVFFVHKNQMVRSTLSVWILFLYEWCEQIEKTKNSSLLGIRYQFPHHWHWMRYYSGKNAPDMHTRIQNNHRKTCGSLLRKWMSRHITLAGCKFRSKFIILPEFKIEKSRNYLEKIVDTKNESYQSSHHLSMQANWNAGFPLISNKVA